MPDKKITELTALATVADDDLLAIVDDPDGTPITKKATVANLLVNKATKTLSNLDANEVVMAETISLSAADIIAMFATPVELIAAPGAGKFLILDNIGFYFDVGGTQFTGGGTVAVGYGTAATTSILAAPIGTAALINGAADFIKVSPMTAGVPDWIARVNDSIVITNATGAFATGNGTAKVFVRYRIVTL